MADTKTLLIPVFDSFIARNILSTEVIRYLANAGLKIIVIPPAGKSAYYSQKYGGSSIVIADGNYWQHDRTEFIFTGLFLHSIPTNFMRIRQSDWYWRQGKYLGYFGASALRFLGKFALWQSFLRNVVSDVEPIPSYLVDAMDTFKPDIVFAPTMIPREEVALMRLARRRGKVTVGMFKSWDNPTSKAFMRVFPDRVICHTEFVKKEAVDLYGFPSDKLIVTGVPQYDRYRSAGYTETREDFFKKMGLDLSKRLIVYAPAGDWMSATDKDVLEILLDAIDSGGIANVQVLLRLHPAYESRTSELAGRKHLIIDRPGKHLTSNIKDVEFDDEETRHLASTMKHADVTINTASTLSIESAIFDTPFVLVGFDGYQKQQYWKSVIRYYDREHYVNVIKAGAGVLARSPDEFITAIREYLENPDLHSEGRARLVREQCGEMDGEAGKRIATAILSLVE